MGDLFASILVGVAVGGYYGLIGVGLSLVFGAMDVVNLAHGETVVIGALVTYAVASAGWPLPAAMAAGALAAVVTGLATYALLIPVRKEPPLTGLVLTFGVATILVNAMLQIWTADDVTLTIPMLIHSVGIGQFSLARGQLLVVVVALAAIILLHQILRHTRLGWSIRAVAQNRDAATTVGISPIVVDGIAFALSALLAGIAGAFLVTVQGVSPVVSSLITIKAFVVVVLAGVGSTWGVVAAALVLGIAESVTSSYFDPTLAPLVAFGLFLAVLLLRPPKERKV